MFRLGVVKYYYDEQEDVREEEYENLNETELAALLSNPDMEVIGVIEENAESYAQDEQTGQ